MTKVLKRINKKSPSSNQDINSSSFISSKSKKIDPEMSQSKNLLTYFNVKSTSTAKSLEKNQVTNAVSNKSSDNTEKDIMNMEEVTSKDKSVTINSISTRNYGKLKRNAPESKITKDQNGKNKDLEKSFEIESKFECVSEGAANAPQTRRQKIKTNEVQSKQQEILKEDVTDMKKNQAPNKKSSPKKTPVKKVSPSKTPTKKTPIKKNATEKIPSKSPVKKLVENIKKPSKNGANPNQGKSSKNNKKDLEMELMNDIENFDEIYDKISDSDCVENENLITSTKVSKKSKTVKKENKIKSAPKLSKAKK